MEKELVAFLRSYYQFTTFNHNFYCYLAGEHCCMINSHGLGGHFHHYKHRKDFKKKLTLCNVQKKCIISVVAVTCRPFSFNYLI